MGIQLGAGSRLAEAKELGQKLVDAISGVIVGQRAVVEQVLWCLLARGHVLLEGPPGLGKTLLVRTLADCVGLDFGRVQFTPDLMPSDITGTNVLLLDGRGASSGRFEMHRGPVFTQLLLADEINRATPKTQSALLEAMQEQAVTISGTRHALPHPFMVLATQNPIEMEGTYPLPEAQLDRFLLMVVVPSPTPDDVLEILLRTTAAPAPAPASVLTGADLAALQGLCRDIAVPKALLTYVVRLGAASAPNSPTATDLVRRVVEYGAGVRAAQSMVLCAKARALLDGRATVAFEDIRAVALPALRHRLILNYEAEADEITTDDVVTDLLAHVSENPELVDELLSR